MSDELPARAQAWVLSQVAGATAVRDARRLTGGLSANTRLLVVERASAPPLEVVLKRFVDVEQAACVTREAEVLAVLADAKLPYGVARLLGRDDAGTECDVPALLTSRVRGCIAIAPDDWEERVRALGDALATFHAQRVPCPATLPDYSVSGEKQRRQEVPNVASLPDWREVRAAVDAYSFTGVELLHGDFHLGNALFEDGQLTGIIDWASARRGPVEHDVAYCRVDLSMLLGADAPECFLAAYEARAGHRIQNPARWDLAASLRAFPDPQSWLPGWLDAGRDDLTPALIRARLNSFVQNALRAL